VAIAAHGNYDRPEWQCASWREVLGTRAFVLCPRGVARPDSPSQSDVRFTYADNHTLEKETRAALMALRARFSAHVAAGPVLWAGFSLGAIMGAKIAARAPEDFSRLVLVEGGHDAWTAASAKAFAAGGGRVLFICGQRGCDVAAGQAARRLVSAGVSAERASSFGEGHSYGGPLGTLVRERLDWLFEGDARW
jgi:pimeloyl-ACP methyl ester carboxylesterase